MVKNTEYYQQFNRAILAMNQDNDHLEDQAEGLYVSATQNNNDEGLCLALMLYGNIRFNKSDYKGAKVYFEKSKSFLTFLTSDYHVGYYYKLIGDMAIREENYIQALTYYFQGLSLCINGDDLFNLKVRIYGNIGYIYMELEVYDKAYSYYEKVIVLSEQSGNSRHLSLTYAKIGHCMFIGNHRREAINYLELSLEYGKKYHSTNDIAYAYYTYGLYYGYHNETELAFKMFERAKHYYREINNDYWLSRIATEKGALHIKNKDYDKAEVELFQCMLMVMNNEHFMTELRIDELLATVYEKKGDYEKAITYYKRYNQLKVLYDQSWKTFQVNTLIHRYEEEERNLEIKELQHEKTILQSLSALGREITSTFQLDRMTNVILKSIFDMISGDVVIFALRNGKQIAYSAYDHQAVMEGVVAYQNNQSPIARYVQQMEVTISENLLEKPPMAGKMILKREFLEGVNYVLNSPLIDHDVQLGSIIVGRKSEVPFVARDVELIKLLSAYVSIAVQNWNQSRELIQRNEQLKELTERDGLTKAYNRYALAQHLEVLNKKASQHREPISAVMIDIDYFKEYNDYYGHLEGDQCLIDIGNLLKNELKDHSARVYRYGGDEFLVVFWSDNAKQVFQLCEGIRKAVVQKQRLHAKSKVNKYVSLTIGIASVLGPYRKIEDVFALADQALYSAKSMGRNNVQHIIKKDLE